MCFYIFAEDGPPGRGTYGTTRAGDRDIGYGARDRGYDDKGPRGGWRDGDGLAGGGDLVRVLLLPIHCGFLNHNVSARE